ncbi:MAG: hypothetical protein UY76_C0067G0001 [Candidatus Uhrbacteria bacterium GW2011_GWA2_52_8d]|uniref:Uncharacterized protein n=1 Tax=Candidatus Uhrbacteria bacterium GW2011_GWA2_52_8d TaxID=1618979 RepID=A0A0G1XJG2_9BACT|nr:MAG: hypothetical protein UY76_C0067G0001 [Candidatus Uhrbacteria bacterium GW2011_GWA2_52_8d]
MPIGFDRETKVKMQVISADSDYVAARLLFMVGILPSAGRLANHVLESYAKSFLWSVNRDELIKEIMSWGGNHSHDAKRILKLISEKCLSNSLDPMIRKHTNILKNFFAVYCMRFMDIFEKGQPTLSADIGVVDMHALDEIVSILRDKIVLQDVSWNQTPVFKILRGEDGGLGKGEREYLLRDNAHLGDKNS